jgi:hypothetical protein
VRIQPLAGAICLFGVLQSLRQTLLCSLAVHLRTECAESVERAQAKPEQGAEVMKFFDWAYKGGDDAAKGLDYVPLPDAVKNQIRATWKSSVKDASGKVVYNH